MRPLGRLERAQHNLGSLHDSEGCHVTTAQMLQSCLLLGCQHDRILGPRAWHRDRPPTLAKVMKTVVCQAFSSCKPAPYFVRWVLSRLDGLTPEELEGF